MRSAISTALIMTCAVIVGCGRIGFDTDTPVDAADGPSIDAQTQLSCLGLSANCGPVGQSSCCASSLVVGGAYLRGYDVATDNAFPDTTNPASVSDFRFDTYEVTVSRFRQFVDAGMGTQTRPPPSGAGARHLNGIDNQGGWDPGWNASLAVDSNALRAAVKCTTQFQTWTDAPTSNEALPMNCITWFEAFAFCAWDGGFLPTEAEWNYAAAGGSEQRAFPWANPPSSLTIDCSYANYKNGALYCVNPSGGAVNRVGSESPAGDGRWGHSDLAGNVWEWTLDGWITPYANPCSDCATITGVSNKALRGGGFFSGASGLRTSLRPANPPTIRAVDFGIRCAR